MKISPISANFSSIFDGMLGHSNTNYSYAFKDIDLKEYHNIKSGVYHRALVKYFQTYDKSGKVKQEDVYNFQSKLDKRI